MWQAGEGRSGWVEEALKSAGLVLARTAKLDGASADRIERLVGSVEHYPAGTFLNGFEGSPKWLLSGWVCEMRILPDARRQIFGFDLPGDMVLPQSRAGQRPCSHVALTRIDCADVERMLRSAGAPEDHELLNRAVAASLAAAQERRYDHIVRLGQYSSSERLVSLLLELRDRLEPLGMVAADSFRLPLTQEQLADTLGLSLIHVHRTLKALRSQGLVEMRLGRVTLLKPAKLDQMAQRGLC